MNKGQQNDVFVFVVISETFSFYVRFVSLIIITGMRSVSIVYKKPQPRQEPLKDVHHSRALLKRSVDQYYTRLLQKEKEREENGKERQSMMQRVKLRTSNSQRQEDRLHILQTLSIAQISLRQPREQRGKVSSLVQGAIQRRIEGTRTILRGLDLPFPVVQTEQDEHQQKNRHCKLKCLLKSKNLSEAKETVLVLSANFITNQHVFWGEEEEIDQSNVKSWRLLQSHTSIVWICQREATFKKLYKFARNNKLRMDAVYVIVPHRKERRCTYSCLMVQNDFGVKFYRSNTPLISKEDRKMVVVSGVAAEKGVNLGWQGLLGSIPIIRNYRSVVHFVRLDMSDKARMNNLVRVLSQQVLPQPCDITSFLADFEKHRERGKVEEQCECLIKLKEEQQQISVLPRIEEAKNKITKFLTQSLSVNLNDRVSYDQSENSVQFLVGDMLRRNCKIFQQNLDYSAEYGRFLAHKKLHRSIGDNRNTFGKTFQGKYRNPAYYWDT